MTRSTRVPRSAAGTLRLGLVMTALAALMLGGCQSLRGADGAATGDQPTASAPDDAVTSPTDRTAPPAGQITPKPPASGGGGQVSADLTVRVDATGKGAVTTSTLTCDPVGGDHPDAAAACAAIAAAGGAAAFEPTPRGVACTEQWGGPQTATVEGTVDGTAITATFSRANGCEIARWDALEALLGAGGLM